MKPEVSINERELMTNGALGLAGEAGEFADMVKKILHQDHPLDAATRSKMILELGDIMFYVATAAASLDVTVSAVMAANVVKLNARYPNGFEATRSLERNVSSTLAGLTDDERRKLYGGGWTAPESESTAASRELLRSDPPIKGRTTFEGPTLREIDEREGLIPARITTTTTSEAEPSALGIGKPLYDERFPNGYSVGRRVQRPWFKEGSGPGRRDSVTPDTQPEATSEGGRDLDTSGTDHAGM